MSHYSKIELSKVRGSAEPIVRALMQLTNVWGQKWTRDQIEVHTVAKSLFGYEGKERTQKAHIVIRRNFVGSASNDIGLRREHNGSWTLEVSNFDKSHGYGQAWQKQFLSHWAIQKIGVEAEAQGNSWSVKHTEKDGRKLAYVSVQQKSWGG